MTHYPHSRSRPGPVPGALPSGLSAAARDVLWGRPVFKAPQLRLRFAPDPLPFTASRVTRVPRKKPD